jgi:hypothetical protein
MRRELLLMKCTGRQQQGRPRAVSRWPRTAGMSVLVPLAAGRAALLVVAAGILVLLVVFAAVIAGAAFAPRQQARESAVRTLDLILRAIPGYRPPPSGTQPAPTPRRPQGATRGHRRRRTANGGGMS